MMDMVVVRNRFNYIQQNQWVIGAKACHVIKRVMRVWHAHPSNRCSFDLPGLDIYSKIAI